MSVLISFLLLSEEVYMVKEEGCKMGETIDA